jgi:(2Fe-2S) ferredoxin
MSFYDKHVFFCTNQRGDGSDCCAQRGSLKAREYMKNKVAELNIATYKNKIRINTAGCLNRCDEGPVFVIYPEGVWYTFRDEKDLDEVIEEHLKNGRVVERLKI